ncbi:MAG: ABC transporter permease [Paludibacteraceae bacterium]|nr:ABC transporter permease [Paludibacteraceae bacterium]MBN2787538.1 ABC transporter permease [Paludibacteraceae bacterium]
MKTFLYILQKEFTQIFRNKIMLRIMILIPIIQLLILVYAATFEVKRIDMAIVDNDRSASSLRLIQRIERNEIFHVNYIVDTQDEAEDLIRRTKIDIALCIPRNFDKKLTTFNHPDVQLLADAIVGNSAQLGSAYLSAIIMDFNKEVLVERMGGLKNENQIIVNNSFWYNANLNYKIYMAPGILVVLLTIIGMMLGGANLVREKELGTIEQINVTPILKWQLLAGKLIPFLIIGLVEMAFGLILAHLFFGMPVRGSLVLLFGATAIYLILVLSIGLFLSTVSDTQQQVAFSGFFFLMIFIMLSGLFTPVESMPLWAQRLDLINPLYYFIKILRGIILKGAQLQDILTEFLSLLALAVSVFVLSILKYKKTT